MVNNLVTQCSPKNVTGIKTEIEATAWLGEYMLTDKSMKKE